MPTKPLRFLYKKYAGHAQNGAGGGGGGRRRGKGGGVVEGDGVVREDIICKEGGGGGGGVSRTLGNQYNKCVSGVDAGVGDCVGEESFGKFIKNHNHTCERSADKLRQLGRELTDAERIQMYFLLSDGTGAGAGGYTGGAAAACLSQTYSSVGSASTNARSIRSKIDRGDNHRAEGSSPTRYRSRSQAFQSKFKLALSRSSPENKTNINNNNNNASNNHNSRNPVMQLPNIQHNNGTACLSTENNDNFKHCNGNVDSNNNDSNNINNLDKYTQRPENKSAAPMLSYSNQRDTTQQDKMPSSSKNTSNRSKSAQGRAVAGSPPKPNLHVVLPKTYTELTNESSWNNLLLDGKEKFPRCHSRSTIDIDRIDSSQYQYLLDDYSSSSSSSQLCSVKSDPASSRFSALAQRPSTTATSRATKRLRELHSGAANGFTTPRTKSRHNSYTSKNNRSPESQWPPRYAIIPSWPSYEDIKTLNSCGQHRNLITQIYRREGKRNAFNSTLHWNGGGENYFRYHRNQHLHDHFGNPIHVVPSHTSMECAMCNLHSLNPHPTDCPPNTPLVIGNSEWSMQSNCSPTHAITINNYNNHDCRDEQFQSRHSTINSLHVNRSSTTLSQTNASSKNTNINNNGSIRTNINNKHTSSAPHRSVRVSISNDKSAKMFSFHAKNTISDHSTNSSSNNNNNNTNNNNNIANAHSHQSRVSNNSSAVNSSHSRNRIPLAEANSKKTETKRVSYQVPSKRDVSYSWDSCTFTYVKAKG